VILELNDQSVRSEDFYAAKHRPLNLREQQAQFMNNPALAL